MSRLAVAALLPLLLAPATEASRRFAFVVGNNRGLPHDDELEFAESDAAYVASTLVQVGAVQREHLVVLQGARLDRLRRALEEQVARLGPEDQWVLFLSGHGDRTGAHVRGEVWSWSEVRRVLERVPARLAVAFVDTCQSGALLTAKGFVRAPPIALSAAPLDVEGKLWITSSGESESSYESALLQGSPFAHALGSGLLGAADKDRDGRVTVEELYAYLYAVTIAETLASPTGPVHPAHVIELRGTGQAVLAQLPAGRARLSRTYPGDGVCHVLDPGEVRVLAEVPAPAGSYSALAPGQYTVKCLAGDRLRVAQVSLGDAEVKLEDLQFETRARPVVLAKGPGGAPVTGLTVAIGVSARDPRSAAAVVSARFEQGLRDARWGLHAVWRPGEPDALAMAGIAARFPWWQLLDTRLTVGAEAGVALAWAGPEEGCDLAFGPSLELEQRLADALRGRLRLDVVSHYPLVGARSPGTRALLTLGVAFDFLRR